MKTKIKLQKDANVIAASGELVGHLDRVVLNPETKVITQIVICNGNLPVKDKEHERVVPITFIAGTTDNEITLREDAGDLESFSIFEEKLPVDASDYADVPPAINDQFNDPLAATLRPPIPAAAMPVPRTTPGQELIPPDQQNIRQGTVAMKEKEGAKVIDLDGEEIGIVERVLADPVLHRATDLLVSRGLLMKQAKLIPADWVKMFDQEKIHLRVKKDSVEKLEDFHVDE